MSSGITAGTESAKIAAMISSWHHDGTTFRPVAYAGVDTIPDRGWVWIDVVSTDFAVISSVGADLGFDPLSIEDVVTDMLPKVDTFDDYRYLVGHSLRFVENRIGTVEFDAFIGPRSLVTFRPGDIYGFDRVREQIEAGHASALGSPAALAAHILEMDSRRLPRLIDALDERIEEMEERAMEADNAVIGAAQALRRDVIVLRRVFGPQRDVLQRLSWDEDLSNTERRAFADVYDHHFRFVESLDSARALIGSIQETHRGAIAARTNEVMKVLTVFSAVVLPLTLIAGVWGMNVRLPLEDDAAAFGWIVGGMVALAIGLWSYFAWRGFVGRIRLDRLPKAVGLSIAHLAGPIIPGADRRRNNDQVRP